MSTIKQKRKSRWGWIRPANINVKIKIVITIVAAALYMAAFPTIVSTIGAAGSALVIFPVGIISWIWGLWGGILVGALAMPVNVVLFQAAGDPITFRGGVSGAITILIVGGIIGWLSTLLGQIYQQSQELAIARDQALEASRLKTAMLSKVSHELRTPLGAILGYAELLTEGVYGPITDEQCVKLNSIIDSSHELELFVSDLLDMSRIESGRLQLFAKPFAIAGLVENVQSKTAVISQKKGLQSICTIASAMPPTVVGDQMRVTQVLTNLVTNAIKYTDEGSVRVEIYPVQNEQWAMKVTDTGIGIAPEAQPYIFDSFRQAQHSDVYARSGIGLGLSIVNELVMLMKGTISVDSTVQQGSCFTVILPLISPTTEETT